MTALTYLCVLWNFAPVPKAKPDVLVLCQEDRAYRAAPEDESVHEGVLVYRERYLLQLRTPAQGKADYAELYLSQPAEKLRRLVGQRVRIMGKRIVRNEKGKVREYVWPGRLMVVAAKRNEEPERTGIFARCDWKPPRSAAFGRQTHIFRSGRQLAEAMQIRGPTADRTATSLLCKKLRVPAIDWDKQMLLCYSAGLLGQRSDQLQIHKVVRLRNEMTVHYTLLDSPSNREGEPLLLTSPSQTILVGQFSGVVQFKRTNVESKSQK